jgi:hypothetical protein
MFYQLKIAIRNLRRNSLYSIINVCGLAVSLAAVIFIMLWVWDELSYERFYKRADDICVAIGSFENDGQDMYWSYTPTAVSYVAREEIPGVETACAVNMQYDLGFVEYEGRKFIGDDFITADTTFFRVFDNTFLEGSSADALPDPYSVVITESMAHKLFGDEPALGKQLTGGNGGGQESETYHVSGVVKDQPANTYMQYSAVFSFERSKHRNTWGRWGFKNFILLQPGADKSSIEKQLCHLHNKNVSNAGVKSYRLQPLPDTRMYAADGSETGIAAVRLFSVIALALLVIACINYVNLVTARAGKRGKEIAVRKILGAKKSSLFGQMTGEAVVLFLAALVIALLLAVLSIPFYNQITGKVLRFSLFTPGLWAICGVMFVSVVLLAGIYPAVKLALFKPLEEFRQNIKSRLDFPLRRALVVCQFVATVTLTVSTIVLNRQMSYMRQKDLGYNREQVLLTNMFSNLNMRSNYRNFKNDLEKEPSVAGVTGSSASIMSVGAMSIITWEGMQDGRDFSLTTEGIDRNFFTMMDMQLVDGSGFTGTPADSSRYFLNETAVRQMGIDQPVGKAIDLPWRGKGVIAGVVKDFHFEHMSQPIGPIIMYLQETPWTIYVRAEQGKTAEAIAATERAWKMYDPDFPFSYRFMDDTFAEMYSNDRMQERLFNIFSVIAVLISCLGLFGLVTFTAETKTREIGIRKVLGASVAGIVEMLSKEFIILAGIAMLIAFPLASYWLNGMLQDYAYRIDISWWMFALAGIITVAVTLLTVGWIAVKAATANPVKSIKTEQ